MRCKSLSSAVKIRSISSETISRSSLWMKVLSHSRCTISKRRWFLASTRTVLISQNFPASRGSLPWLRRTFYGTSFLMITLMSQSSQTKQQPLERCLGVYNSLTRIFLSGCSKVLLAGTKGQWNWRTEVNSWLHLLLLLPSGVCLLMLYFWTNLRSFRIILQTSSLVLFILLFRLVNLPKLLSSLPLTG